jgi:hypothetical protein
MALKDEHNKIQYKMHVEQIWGPTEGMKMEDRRKSDRFELLKVLIRFSNMNYKNLT